MNPPSPFSPDQALSGTAPAHPGTDVVGAFTVDQPCHLTFDEMRELPMHIALGFDTEGEQ